MRRSRATSATVLLVLGGVIAAATWAGGDHGLAVGLVGFYVIASAAVFAWSGGRGDVAAIMRTDGDERQRAIDRDATAASGLAMGLFAIGGAAVQLARGEDPNAFVWVCTVGGFSYMAAVAVLRRRR